ncbi:MAG: GNAT family N-acetyltransferase [Acidobacteriota bacterium]
MGPTSDVRKVHAGDVRPLATVLARALDADPIFVALFPDAPRRSRTLARLFREWIRVLHLPHEASWTTDDLAGGALWSPPGAWKIGVWDELRMAPRLAGALGARAIASLRVLAAVEARHPAGPPHHYLRLLGCDPARQGQGIGSRLLRPMLDACDARREPAFLESSNEQNHPFYRRHGFETIEVIETHLGPRVWLMWRDPR